MKTTSTQSDHSQPAGTATSLISAATGGKKFPAGLARLAFTEFWERFSFYGLQAVLIFYLLYSLDEGGLEVTPTVAASIVGAYGGLVYFAQILGSWMGDRLISPKWLVFWGGIVITAGHLSLGLIPGYSGLAIGLGMIVLGTGALKTNITSIVGMLLDDNPRNRDAGFSYFYMAINIGATVGGIATGFLQTSYGFQAAFLAASIGMVAALIQYVFVMKRLPRAAGLVANPLAPSELWRPVSILFAIIVAITVVWTTGLLNEANLASATAIVVLATAAMMLAVLLRSSTVTTFEKTRIVGFIPLFIASSLFFGLLFQVFSALPIMMADGRIGLKIGDWSVPPMWVLLVGTVSAVLFTPVIARFWSKRDGLGPNTAGKFATGLLQIAFGNVLIVVVMLVSGPEVALLPVVIYLIIVGSSEVFVGPTGLSVATRIAPAAHKSQLVAMIFLTLAAGSTFGGILGQISTTVSEVTYFTIIAGISGGLGLVMFFFRARINAKLEVGLNA